MDNELLEILTYEVFKKTFYEIRIPVQNLIAPNFLLKGSSLYIFLYSYEKGYVIKDLPIEVVNAIKKGNCVIVESLHEERTKHKVVLFRN